MNLTFRRVFTAEQQGEYPEVEFELPMGYRQIAVNYRVEPAGETTVDLGLADPCGLRGWSGGARTGFVITPSRATPGYLPGLMRPGVWKVLLGLYQVPAQGCEVVVEVECQQATGWQWYRGDFHTHTHHSDARGSVAQLAAAALGRGLDFLAIADHNTVAHHAELPSLPCTIAAQEVTTYRGHFTALGGGPYLEFRQREVEGVARVLEQAYQARLLRVLAHPKPTCPSCDWGWGLEERFDAMEVWNGPWATLNWLARDRWVAALNRGLRLPALGGSDRHQPDAWPDPDPAYLQVGSPTTFVLSPVLSPGDLLTSVLQHRTCVSESPGGPLTWWEASGDQARLFTRGARGMVLEMYDQHGLRRSKRLEDELTGLAVPFERSSYLRAEIRRAWLPAELEYLQAQGVAFPELGTAALSSAVWPEPR